MNYPKNNLGTIHRAFRHCLIAWGLNETRNRGLVFFKAWIPKAGMQSGYPYPLFFKAGKQSGHGYLLFFKAGMKIIL
jgi:hypothetical protein